MYGGIDQLVDTYKGNPQPLAEKMQKSQQGQPPGRVPPDLEEAIALQKIAELRNSAQGQQAMQAGGAQPSIVDKLKQMIGQNQMQAQMQGQPVMAASGGSIDQLMSNLGQHYAGGGIVAFNGKDGSSVPTEEELEAQRKADKEKIDALTRVLGQTGGEYAGKSMAALADIASLIPRGLAGAVDTAVVRPARALGADVGYLSPALTPGNQDPSTKTPFYDRYIRAKESSGKTPSEAPSTVKETEDPEIQKLKRLAAVRAQTGQNTNPALQPRPPAAPTANVPSTANVNAPAAPAAPAKPALDPNSLRALSEKMIREEMGLNPETESDKMVARARKLMGIDEILNEKRARVGDFEKAVAESKANRTPEWIKALQAAGGAPVRGGIGMLLGQMGAAATKTREGYDSQDLEYKRELNRLRDIISDAQLSGNKELAKTAMDAYKEVDARRKAGLTSATSLLNVDQQTEASNQRAREALASRNQIAAAQAEAKKTERQRQQQNWIAEQERKWQDTLSRNPEYKKLIDQRSFQERLLYMPNIDPKAQEKAQAAVDAINERIAKMLPTAGGGTVNIPPPPKGAVTRVG